MVVWVCIVAGLIFIPYWMIVRRQTTSAGTRTWLVFGYWALVPAIAILFAVAPPSRRSTVSPESAVPRPIEVAANGYVSSKACRECHPHEHATWHASYHRTMTQIASPETVVGRFGGPPVLAKGKTYHLKREGDRYTVELDAPRIPGQPRSATRVKKPIVMLTGSHHMQLCWYANGHAREVRLVPLVYLFADKKWVPRESVFLGPPDNALDNLPWNDSCIECHATQGKSRIDKPANYTRGVDYTMQTSVVEFGISCEACHGPGESHIKFHRDGRRDDSARDPIVHPRKISHKRSAQICGSCHAATMVRQNDDLLHLNQHGSKYRPGDDLEKSSIILGPDVDRSLPRVAHLLRRDPHVMEDRFWSDGMLRVSGREYHGLAASPCFKKGKLSCLSCHAMHQPKTDSRPVKKWADDQLHEGMRGNHACTQCHQEYRDKTRLAAHTHHKSGSTGSNCYNCHMPHTAYGLLKSIRSHQISSPDVTVTKKTGRPNACNLCHLDKTLAWTGKHLSDWYDIKQPSFNDDEQSIAASLLWLLKGDAGQRALTACAMQWPPARKISGKSWMAPFLAELLDDPYDAVRYVAGRSLKSLSGFEDFEYDFVSLPTQRRAARRKAVALWTRRRQLKLGSGLLIDSNGNLKRNKIDRLLRKRDDRRVNLRE